MDAHASGPAGSPITGRALARGVAWDVGLPLATYYVLHAAGVGEWRALLAATLVAAARIGLAALRERALNPFALVMLVAFGVSLAVAFATGDARLLLVKDSVVTAALGALFLVLAWFGHPLTLAAAQRLRPDKADELAARYRADPAARRRHLTASAVWGVGLLAEASVRVPLIYLLPIQVMVAVSAALMMVALLALLGWTAWYIRRAQPLPGAP